MARPKKQMLWSPWEAISCFAKPDLKWVAQMCPRGGFRSSGIPKRVPGGAAVILGGELGGARGGNGKLRGVWGGAFWVTGRTQNHKKNNGFMCIFAMGEFLEGPLNGPKNSRMYSEGQRGPRGNGRGA